MNKTKVVVAMLGSVDSLVAPLLLKEQGYNVIGISLKLLPEEETERSCCSFSSIEDARRVAEKILQCFVWKHTCQQSRHIRE